MATIKKLVCLANSRKHGGRCVAGIEINSNSWIRPVSSRPGHEVSAAERQYSNGIEPCPLDIVSMRLIEPKPIAFHQENWLLDPSVRWQKEGQVEWGELCLLEEPSTRLWRNGYHTYAGSNDRMPADQEGAVMDSLKLIRVDGATINVDHSWPTDARLTVRAEFQHGGSFYSLKVTDPVCEEKFRKQGIGRYSLGDSFLTISLSEEFEGYLYKLVAAVVERAKVEPNGRR
ncbi:hypothetical protein [Streptomyces sp. NPDC057375]|uniref:dual OB domain-containing protein n=1 Tax=Streptomyces sp. NPDC057375 TaxID=3346109 RepID=UPI00363FB0E9